MQKTVGHVLKSNQVQFEGRLQLTLPSRGDRMANQAPASSDQQVRIVENNSEYVLMEVTCCCGTKTYVKCEYAGTEIQTT